MSKIIKNTPVFLLWLAGLAFCAHLMIPHDHHLGNTCSDQEDTCPVSNKKTSHSAGYPIHCHAFNDVASEKAISYHLIPHVQNQDVSIIGFLDGYTFDLQVACTTIFDIRKPFPDFHLLELSQLRAPPSLS